MYKTSFSKFSHILCWENHSTGNSASAQWSHYQGSTVVLLSMPDYDSSVHNVMEGGGFPGFQETPSILSHKILFQHGNLKNAKDKNV